jgi:predicted transcriptional regulator
MRKPLSADNAGEAPRVTLRIAAADLDRLDDAARRRGVDRSVAVRLALADWLDRGEAKIA